MAEYDGHITLGVKVDTSGAKKAAEDVKKPVIRTFGDVGRELKAALEGAASGIGSAFSPIVSKIKANSDATKELNFHLKDAKNTVNSLKLEYALLMTKTTPVSREAQNLAVKIRVAEQDVKALSSAMERVKQSRTALNVIKKGLSGIATAAKVVGNSVASFGKKIAQTAARVFVFRVLYSLMSKIGEAIGNILAQDAEIQADWEEIKTAFTAALQPIVTVLMPLIKTVLSLLKNFAVSIGESMASMTGQDYHSIVDATEASKENMEDSAESAEQLSQSFSGLDDLEVLSDGNETATAAAGAEEAEETSLSGIAAGAEEAGDGITDSVSNIGEMVGNMLIAIVEMIPGLLGPLIVAVGDLCTGLIAALPGLINTVLDTAFDLATDVVTMLPDVLVPLLTSLPEMLLGIVRSVKDMLPVLINAASFLVEELIKALPEIFGAIVEMMPELIWDLIVIIMEVLIEGVRMIINICIALIEAAINLPLATMEKHLNNLIKGLNLLLTGAGKVANAIGSLFGQEWNVPTIPLLSFPRVSIPRLATGAVIPPNQEFMAILGDQKSGVNVEAPLDTIKDAVRSVFNEKDDGIVEMLGEILTTICAIKIGDDTIGKAANRYNASLVKINGG